jgi:hypothetical protein
MDTNYNKKPLVELVELKRNLRIDAGVEVFDADLATKLRAAIAAAGSFIGRDLMQVPVYSYPYAASFELAIDPAVIVKSVAVGEDNLNPSDWTYADGVMKLSGEFSDDKTVTVETAYKEDIVAAVLMHASSLWMNPADAVEQLPKSSTNLLRQYRRYHGR